MMKNKLGMEKRAEMISWTWVRTPTLYVIGNKNNEEIQLYSTRAKLSFHLYQSLFAPSKIFSFLLAVSQC
jgi:hypothetical protein